MMKLPKRKKPNTASGTKLSKWPPAWFNATITENKIQKPKKAKSDFIEKWKLPILASGAFIT
jgi:hypothetical protein